MDIDVVQLANMMYGENASEDYDTMVMTGSSAMQRLLANKPKEFGATLPEVLQKGYCSVSQNSPMYQQASSGKFPDEKSELKYKQAMQIGYGLKKWITPVEGYSGNIDLINRPIVRNSDGNVSTEISKSFNFDGQEVLIPTIVNGKKVSDQDAINHYRKTGENLGIFKSVKEANAMAEKIHNRGIPLTKGQFYFTDSEVKKLQKNKKAFDFSKVKSTGKVGKYTTYSY